MLSNSARGEQAGSKRERSRIIQSDFFVTHVTESIRFSPVSGAFPNTKIAGLRRLRRSPASLAEIGVPVELLLARGRTSGGEIVRDGAEFRVADRLRRHFEGILSIGESIDHQTVRIAAIKTAN